MADTLDVDALLTASQLAEYAKVSVQAVVNWRNRGHLRPAVDLNGNEIRDGQGRLLYRLLDGAIAEQRTSKRARRA